VAYAGIRLGLTVTWRFAFLYLATKYVAVVVTVVTDEKVAVVVLSTSS